jgi:hypothetical protein
VRELFGVNTPFEAALTSGHEDRGSRVCSRVVSRCTSLQAAPGRSKESCFGSELERDLARSASAPLVKSDVQPEDPGGSLP